MMYKFLQFSIENGYKFNKLDMIDLFEKSTFIYVDVKNRESILSYAKSVGYIAKRIEYDTKNNIECLIIRKGDD